MSLSKRYQDKLNEQNSPGKCLDCKWNFDDRFFELCPRHEREAELEISRYYHEAEELDNEFYRF